MTHAVPAVRNTDMRLSKAEKMFIVHKTVVRRYININTKTSEAAVQITSGRKSVFSAEMHK
jgi:transposase